MYRSSIFLLATCILFLGASRRAQADALLLNGGFEAGGGSSINWSVASSGDSAWLEQSGNASPVNNFTVPVAPEGTYTQMTDGVAPGSAALMQSFLVPLDALNVTLSFEYFILNPDSASGTYTIPSPDSLDWTGDPVQQARVDILTQGDSAFDVTPVSSGGGLVANLFQTQPGDSNGTDDNPAYKLFSANITADLVPGDTYEIAFSEANNLGQLVFGIDNVQITSSNSTIGSAPSSAPEPGTMLLLSAGLLALGGYRAGRQRTIGLRAAVTSSTFVVRVM
jgi:hypothetical protein